jgi:hypothetical protein
MAIFFDKDITDLSSRVSGICSHATIRQEPSIIKHADPYASRDQLLYHPNPGEEENVFKKEKWVI